LGKGFSEDNLGRMKNFYILYSPVISATPLRKLQDADNERAQIRQTSSDELQNANNTNNQISSTVLTKSIPEFLFELVALSKVNAYRE
jgi:hypothetical protein